jgi:hypothetical protein
VSEFQRLSDDDRYSLAARAEAGARANRPGHLVAIAGLALLLCLTVAAFAWRADASAAKTLRRESFTLDNIRVRADRLAELKADLAAAPTDDRYRPIPDILSRMSNLATEAGIAGSIPVPTTGTNLFQESRRLTYQYRNLRVDSLEPVVRWINLCTERIPGLHPTGIKITPQANAWQVDIMFARYERLN